MAQEHAVIDAILRRRSVPPRKLTAPGPDKDQLSMIVEAATVAPDHGRIRPWRLFLIADRNALAAIFSNATREIDPHISEDLLRREAERAHHAPCLIAVIARIDKDHAIAPPSEQWISVGAALQNILLAAEDLGFRAMMVSGKKVGTDVVRKGFTLSDGEELVGFVAIGSATVPAKDRQDTPDAGVLTVWDSDSGKV
jgi:nitroreductase